ncbi:hypothetical protein [Zoogloea sp. 1C4]|uniref:hypothetical protein n=1 Tax=Zoogloea sp. 1C4 TaxID=2570190 RepID=UPI00129291E6|nr:hypothetical protein [Zoogloea sp. 1C4]
MFSLSWKRALSLSGLTLTADEKAAGWPDALDIENLSTLQYPPTGTAKDKAAARRNRQTLIDALEDALDQGNLEMVERTYSEEVFRCIPVRRCPHEGVDIDEPYIDPDQWKAVGGRFREVSAGFESTAYAAVTRDSFRRWLEEQGEPPSAHVQAWFDAGGRNTAAPPTPAVPPSESPGDVLERILGECQRRAKALGLSFDVNNMPGQIAQFHDLCSRLDPVFGRQTSIDSFKRYTKAGRCRWSLQARANDDATPLYQKLFPEAFPTAGAQPGKRRKA